MRQGRLPSLALLALPAALALCAAALCAPGLSALAAAVEFPIDLNSAPLEEIEQLPVSPEVARAIFEYREYRSYFKSVYDLATIEGIDAEALEELKPLVRIEPVAADQLALDLSEAQRNIRSWGASEGSNEGLIDLWIDIAKDRPNINTAGIYDLMNLQNISAVDAVAIYKHRKAIDSYRSRRDLRYTPNLSGWGYMNARSLVRYEDTEKTGDLHGRYQVRARSASLDADFRELFLEDTQPAEGVYESWYDRLSLDRSPPEVTQKAFLKYYLSQKVTLHGGALLWRSAGESDLAEHGKGFAGIEGLRLGPVSLDKLYVGDYLVSFGQGLVMENSDYFKSRKSGYSWDTRYYGILGDMSRSEEYKLSGAAAQATWGSLKAIGFYSDDRKDVVLNPDGSAAAYIVLNPSVENDVLTRYGLPAMRDALYERTFGGNLRYVILPGTHVGLSGYQSTYNRRFDPQGGAALIARMDKTAESDEEFFQGYKSPGTFRRIYGAELQTVYRNYCLQAEYAEMDLAGDLAKIGDDPHALVASLWSQYNNLNLLVLYRDYTLGFDNPYCRGFANYSRFKGTIFEDQYYLSNPIYGLIYDRSAVPQAERGVYVSSRFRVARDIIPRIEYDRWTRVSDGASYSRFVGTVEARLVYPLRLKLRQQFQGRNQDDAVIPNRFDLSETRVELEMRLSAYDLVEFMYLRGATDWPPRPRLVDNFEPDGDHPASGQASQPANALLVHALHNFNDALSLSAGAVAYDGFIWFFEENDFRALDGKNSLRFWISVQDRVSDRLWVEAKVAYDRNPPTTNLDIRQYNQPYGDSIDADNLVTKDKYFRIQIDYMW